MYQYFCRTEISFWDKKKFLAYLESMTEKRIVIVLSKRCAKRFGLHEFVERLQKSEKCIWISQSVSYPTQDTIHDGLVQIGQFNPEVIIAIGGGSCIDYAKELKAFCAEELYAPELILEKIQTKSYEKRNIEIVAVPTTAGTGAEVTQWATVWDQKNEVKYSVDHENFKPNKAIYVPELMIDMDSELTVSTALDAYSHAVESYWSKKSNPLVRALAIQSMELITEYLEKVLENPHNLIYREKMSLAALLSGLAFSMTRTTACHSISYPLTMMYQIPHGIAVAMTLLEVAEINGNSYLEYDKLAEQLEGYERIIQRCVKDKIPFSLKEYGVTKDDIIRIVEKTFTLGRMDNNPVLLTKEDVYNILKHIY